LPQGLGISLPLVYRTNTTQAAILLPLRENGGTGLYSFALPLSHFLRWGEEKKQQDTQCYSTDDEINMGGFKHIRSTPYLSVVVEQLRHHFTGHKPSMFFHN
jgi:hypothetical protein